MKTLMDEVSYEIVPGARRTACAWSSGSASSDREAGGATSGSSLNVSNLEALLESAQLLHSSLDLDELAQAPAAYRHGAPRRCAAASSPCATGDADACRAGARVQGLEAGDAVRRSAAPRESGWRSSCRSASRRSPLGMLALAPPPAGHRCRTRTRLPRGAGGHRGHRHRQRPRARAGPAASTRGSTRRSTSCDPARTRARAVDGADGPEEVAHLLGLTLAGQWAASRYAVLAAAAAAARSSSRQKGTALAWHAAVARELDRIADAPAVDEPRRSALFATRCGRSGSTLVFPLRRARARSASRRVGPRPGGACLRGGRPRVRRGRGGAGGRWRSRTPGTSARSSSGSSSSASSPWRQASSRTCSRPSCRSSLRRCDMAAMNRPARLVGGDYYDALVVDAPAARRTRAVLRRRRLGQGDRRVAADEQHPGDAARAARTRGVARRTRALHQRPALHEHAREQVRDRGAADASNPSAGSAAT